ncbi:MAG: response regulator [Alphaproteobacteria bacterium]|nr:response regulator [Alphaproteobacteria bacterium]QQS56346.1 MAG: response regulator [Alphaproteobacteria bacterium]
MECIANLSENAKLMEAAIVNAKDGVIITTADLNNPTILYVNEAVTRISGYEAHELIGQTPRILQGRDTDRKVLRELKDCLSKGRPFKGELKNYTKDGIPYWLDISITPVRNDEGVVTHFTAIERDITQRKAFEKELQVSRESAEVAKRSMRSFLANMSHELRTPMNGILGLSELLAEMPLQDDQKELSDAIHISSRSLLNLLNDILDLSKIEANELILETIPFDLRQVVRQTIDLQKPLASRKGIALEYMISPEVPDRIVGDPGRFQQVLNNLISNAIKFTESGKVLVTIEEFLSHPGERRLNIKVQDSGIGIPLEKQQIIFEKFIQADVTTARKYGGTGLGLSITRELVEMMNGTIDLESTEGEGTIFYLDLPLINATAESDSSLQKALASTNNYNRKARVLVVDDHPVNLLFMRKVLKKMGFMIVDEAESGHKAIEAAEKNRYDLIFMDCQMPEIDGFEASEIIREKEALIGDVLIIAVTADAMRGAREKCLDAGMNDYISKPVDISKLTSVLEKWLPCNNSFESPEDDQSFLVPLEPVTQSIHGVENIFDWDRLRIFAETPEEEEELIGIFVNYAQESLDILKASVAEQEYEQWKKAAHKLKGSAANLGAQKLSELCFEAEKAFEAVCEEKGELYRQIKGSYSELLGVLGDRVPEGRGSEV